MSAKINYNRGTSYAFTLTYKENGVAADITASTVYFTVKTAEYDTEAADTAALISKTITSHTDPTNGVTTIRIDPIDTQLTTPGNYYYDIKIKKAGGQIYKLIEDRFKIDGSPTNRQT